PSFFGGGGPPAQPVVEGAQLATKRTIWVTRSAPGAQETGARLWAMGLEPLIAPLLELRALPVCEIDLTGVGAIAFTSANAARAFARASAERRLPVFTVGATTAAAASKAGFVMVHSAAGAVSALAAAIAERRPQFRGFVLHPAAAEPAGDLAGDLARRGIEARVLALYESTPGPVPQTVLARIPSLDGVLLHSPKAARALGEILARAPAPNLRAYCLSEAVARPLAGATLAEVVAASSPTEQALLELIVR
ncbi:MAG TPA: uroporphyrinogen-III synthase, partial [Caulobacteraceae bacterium]